MRRLVKAFVLVPGVAATIVAAGVAYGQPASSLPRPVLLEKARQGFDSYMLGEFELASLARTQKSAFPNNWNRLRERFANVTADRIEGKIDRERAQSLFRTMIQESFAEINAAIGKNRQALGHAPHEQLVAWEMAVGEHLSRHFLANPATCRVIDVVRAPATPAETVSKLKMVEAYWAAYDHGQSTPIPREFDSLSETDVAALEVALKDAGARPTDVKSIMEGSDAASISCAGRQALSKAVLSMTGDAQDRLLAHIITRSVTN